MKRNLILTLIALALALTMTGLFATSAFAAPFGSRTPSGPIESWSPGYPPVVAIFSTVEMPKGTTLPAVEFDISATLLTVNGETRNDMANPLVTSSWKHTHPNLPFNPNPSDMRTAISLEDHVSWNILEGAQWPVAGVYVFQITLDNVPAQLFDLTHTDGYYLTVYVENLPGGGLWAKVAEIRETLGSNDKYEDMVFGGKYRDYRDITIRKQVSGAYGDMTQLFDFEIHFARGAFENATQYSATIIRANGDPELVPINLGDEFSPGISYFQLAHGDTLTISNAQVGSIINVIENGALGYTASAEFNDNTDLIEKDAPQGQRFITNPIRLYSTPLDVLVTNEFTMDMTAEGLILTYAPFIALLVLATVGGVALVWSRRNRTDAA